jgi:hypothetical protein
VLQGLPEEIRQTLRAYVAEVGRLFGSNLEGVVLYGSAARGEYLPGRSNLNLLLVLMAQDAQALARYGGAHRRWQREGIVVPLFLTGQEIHASAAVFPLEFLDMQEAHVLLKGRDPFPELQIDPRHLRVQCEQELRGNLLRLRQRFVEGGGKPESAAILLPLSLTALLPVLRGILRLRGARVPSLTDALLGELRTHLGLDPAVLQDVLKLKRGLIGPGPVEVPRLFERYLAGLQDLVGALDRLTTSPSS